MKTECQEAVTSDLRAGVSPESHKGDYYAKFYLP
jgi:hypothetical protein